MQNLRTCPSCNGEWDDEAIFCPDDGAPLAEARLDRYRLVRRVARGGMSDLFEARHEHIDRRFALKLMRADLGADVEAVERLRREARAASAIGHPNIIDVTDFGQTADGSVYMVMEWIDGETVRQLLDRGPVDPMLALEIAYQAAAGLAAAHSIGVVHRDVKPANLGLTRREDGSVLVKVLDFGIAKLTMGTAPKLTKTGIFLGTPSYASPEQALGENLDGRSDVYSLGCVMYEMFTGQKVFGPQSSPMELAKLHATAMPMPPSQRTPGRQISADIDAIVMCCLAKARDKRFPSMARLRDTLDQMRSGMATLHGEPPGMDMTGAHGRPGADDNKVTLLFQRGMAVEFRQAAPLEPTQIVEPGQGPFAARDSGPPMTIPIELPPSAGMPMGPTVIVSPMPTPLPLDPPGGEPVAPLPVVTATPPAAPRKKSRKFLVVAAAVAVIAAMIGVVAARGTKRGQQTTAAKTEKAKSAGDKSASKTKSASKSKSKSAAANTKAKPKPATATAKSDASAKPATAKSEAPVAAKAVETAAATGTDAKPAASEPEPAADGKPAADAKPAVDTKAALAAVADGKPAAEAKPAAETKAVAETKPAADAKAVAETKPAADAKAVAETKPAADAKAEAKPAVADAKPAPATATKAAAPAPATPAAVTPAVAVAAPAKPAAAGGAWTSDIKAAGFQLKVVATPRPLMPSAPIALQVTVHHASPAIARRLGKGKLIADVHFRHLAQRSARGMVSDKVDPTGAFDAIFSVPEPGRYQLRVALTDGVRPLGQATLSVCVGADPDGPDAAKICPTAAPIAPRAVTRRRPVGVRLDEPVEEGGAPR